MNREDDRRDELGRLNDEGGGQVGWRSLRSIARLGRVDSVTRRELGRTGTGRTLLRRFERAFERQATRASRVFLAHGFHRRDAPLVRELRKALRAKRLQVVTGEKPAPKSVSAKVLDRIDRTWGFVALFTCDPLAVGSQPSPWIVSELGYAARKPRVVLLERPLKQRQIGGIQGDVEYISFDRSAPVTAFRRAAQSASEA